MTKARILPGIICSLLICCSLSGCDFPYKGKVIDKQTGQPIEGAVIVRSWKRTTISPVEPVIKFLGMKEGLSDAGGHFAVPGLAHFPSIPILSYVEENETFVYKPGYKFLSLKDKSSVIRLERIPTSMRSRKYEYDDAKNNYKVDVEYTSILMDMLSKEEEFIESIRLSSNRKRDPLIMPFQSKPLVLTPSNKSGAGIAVDMRVAEPNRDGGTIISDSPVTSKEDRVVFNIKVLADRSVYPYSRASAADSLGYVKDSRAVQALIEALKDQSEIVRYSAAHALGKQQDPQAVPFLINLLGDEANSVRGSAIEALGMIQDTRAIPHLLHLLKDEDRNIRIRAYEALGKLRVDQSRDPGIKEAVDLLVKDLGDEDINVRGLAAHALVKFGEQAVAPLAAALKSDDFTVKSEAASVLGAIGNPNGIDPLISLLNSGDRARLAAAEALGHFDDPRAIEALVNALKKNDADLSNTVSSALTRPPALDYLLPALNESDETLRLKILYILRFIKDPRVEDPFISLLSDHNHEVRNSAAIGLLLHPTVKAIKPLISAWKDRDAKVRTNAAEALVAIGSPATDQLIQATTANESYVRWRAAWCLGRIRDTRAVDALLAALNDKVSEVRWSAVDALEQIEDIRAINKLMELCHDSDSGIREKAESALVVISRRKYWL